MHYWPHGNLGQSKQGAWASDGPSERTAPQEGKERPTILLTNSGTTQLWSVPQTRQGFSPHHRPLSRQCSPSVSPWMKASWQLWKGKGEK